MREVKNKQLFTVVGFARELKLPLVFAHKLIKWGLITEIEVIDGVVHVTENGITHARELLKNPYRRFKLYWRSLGPGLITGASDDDPSGIATYSTVGAKFGYSLLWMCLWLLPMMMAIQEVCARIGIITNKGIAAIVDSRYKKWVSVTVCVLLLIANIVNIGADLEAMAAASEMLFKFDFLPTLLFFTILIIVLEIYFPYEKYVAVLKWLSLVLFTYFFALLIIGPEWRVVLHKLFVPEFKLNEEYIFAMIAFFGTTITPYLFFWQASQEVEENKVSHFSSHNSNRITKRLMQMHNDVKSGMILSNFITLCIVVTTAETLYKNGITNIDTAEQAALALKPLAGHYAYLLFGLGIIGTGFLAIPVLAGACAYAVSEVWGVQGGLNKKFHQAKFFYSIIILSILTGSLLHFIGINPMQALYYTAWLNGIISLPLMYLIMKVGGDKKIMGENTHAGWVKFFGWLAVIAMALGICVSVILYVV